MDKKASICNYLKKDHTGKDKAVFSRELERLFSLDGRGLRRIISALRQEGHPICSDGSGYYYAENQKEIDMTVRRLSALAKQISVSRTGLLNASVSESEPVQDNTNLK